MLRQTRRWLLLIGLVCVFLSADRAWGIGFILGQTKEELKLKYDVSVHDHGNGRATIVFSIADEGRLKPLDGVELMVPTKEKDANGGYGADLSVPLAMKKDAQGNQVVSFEITKDLAARAQIWLTTTTLDGKRAVMERYHHVIPVAGFLNQPRTNENESETKTGK